MPRHLTEPDFHQTAANIGAQWTGKNLVDSKTKTDWICSGGHNCRATYGNVKQGRLCRPCFLIRNAERTRLDSSAYETAGRPFDVIWLGDTIPQNNRTKTLWRCSEKHSYETTIESVRNGGGCQKCKGSAARERQQFGLQDYNEAGAKLALVCLASETEIINGNLPVPWRCETCKFEFRAKYGHIQQGSGCRSCSNERLSKDQRLPDASYHNLAKVSSLTWLGPSVSNANMKTKWGCGKHEFLATYGKIYSGRGCPHCKGFVNGSPVSRAQLLIQKILGRGRINAIVGRYRIDIAMSLCGENIAIEYDGIFWHEGNEERDENRQTELEKLGWKFIRLKETKKLYTVEKMHGPKRRNIRSELKIKLENAMFDLLNGKQSIVIDLHQWISQFDTKKIS